MTELNTEEPMPLRMVDLLGKKLQATHELFEANIKLIDAEAARTIEAKYLVVREPVLQKIIHRYRAVLHEAGVSYEPRPEATTTNDGVSARDCRTTHHPQPKAVPAKASKSTAVTTGGKEWEEVLEIHASDNDESMPLEYMSLIRPTAAYTPVTFAPSPPHGRPATGVLAEGTPEKRRKQGKTKPGEPSRTPESTDLRNKLIKNRVNPFARTHRQSMNSIANVTQPAARLLRNQLPDKSYNWVKQTRATGPIRGITYPPMMETPPRYMRLGNGNPTIVGMAERWTQKVGNRRPTYCAFCRYKEDHRMYQCPVLRRENIQQRWLEAIKLGVCLNCLTIGHSSFTCQDRGCCPYHGTRHSSFLCGASFNNQE